MSQGMRVPGGGDELPPERPRTPVLVDGLPWDRSMSVAVRGVMTPVPRDRRRRFSDPFPVSEFARCQEPFIPSWPRRSPTPSRSPSPASRPRVARYAPEVEGVSDVEMDESGGLEVPACNLAEVLEDEGQGQFDFCRYFNFGN